MVEGKRRKLRGSVALAELEDVTAAEPSEAAVAEPEPIAEAAAAAPEQIAKEESAEPEQIAKAEGAELEQIAKEEVAEPEPIAEEAPAAPEPHRPLGMCVCVRLCNYCHTLCQHLIYSVS